MALSSDRLILLEFVACCQLLQDSRPFPIILDLSNIRLLFFYEGVIHTDLTQVRGHNADEKAVNGRDEGNYLRHRLSAYLAFS